MSDECSKSCAVCSMWSEAALRLLSLGLVVLSLASVPEFATAVPIPFTGPAVFTAAPSTTGGGALVVEKIPVGSGLAPGLVNTPNGFKMTGNVVRYTTAIGDVGKTITIDWTAERPFTVPAGPFVNVSRYSLSADLVVANGSSMIVDFFERTDHVWEGLPSAAVASNGPFALSPLSSSFSTKKAARSPVFHHDGVPDALRQYFRIRLTPAAVGQDVRFFFLQSVDSATFPVPEPGTLLLAAVAMLGAVGLAWRCRRGRERHLPFA